MMSPRNLKNQLRYKRYMKNNPEGCGFCRAIEEDTDQVVRTHSSLTILRNMFPYSRWDGRGVADHLMIVPKRHITDTNSLAVQESQELIELMREYDMKGYSFYIRSDTNRSKSMAHLHGHLILTK